MKRMILAVPVALVGSLLVAPVAQAGPQTSRPFVEELATKVVSKPTCDRRAPRIKLTTTKPASGIMVGEDTGVDHVLKSGNVKPGTYRFTLPRQPFGSTRTWVMVVLYKGDQGATTSRPLTFKRPKAENCIRTRLVELESFGKRVNMACPKGTVKDLMVRVWVKRGSPGYITNPGDATLTLRSGAFKSAPGQLFRGGRMAEYHVFVGRTAKLDFNAAQDAALNVSSVGVGPMMSSVVRVCTGRGV